MKKIFFLCFICFIFSMLTSCASGAGSSFFSSEAGASFLQGFADGLSNNSPYGGGLKSGTYIATKNGAVISFILSVEGKSFQVYYQDNKYYGGGALEIGGNTLVIQYTEGEAKGIRENFTITSGTSFTSKSDGTQYNLK